MHDMLYSGMGGKIIIGPITIDTREVIAILPSDYTLSINLRGTIGELKIRTKERAEEVLKQIHENLEERGYADITKKIVRIL